MARYKPSPTLPKKRTSPQMARILLNISAPLRCFAVYNFATYFFKREYVHSRRKSSTILWYASLQFSFESKMRIMGLYTPLFLLIQTGPTLRMNRDPAVEKTITSPLLTHKPATCSSLNG